MTIDRKGLEWRKKKRDKTMPNQNQHRVGFKMTTLAAAEIKMVKT